MSSKKARRKQRQEQEQKQEGRRGKLNPVTLFMLGIGAAVVIAVLSAVVFGDGSDRGEPPWPGAVWSAPHGHWH
jgi:hypothetical protein